MVDGLAREEIHRRYERLIGEIFRRADTPTRVAVILKGMGWLGEGGRQYSDRNMTSWRTVNSYPNPEQLMALAHKFGVSIDDYMFGEGEAPSGVAERVADQGEILAELQSMVTELAQATGHGDIISRRRRAQAADEDPGSAESSGLA